MNLIDRIKAKIVGWHADYYTGFSRLEDKYKDKEYPGDEKTDGEEEVKSDEPHVRVYTEELARELAEEMKAETGVPYGRMRIRHSAPHVRVIPEPVHQMNYPGLNERGKILDELSKGGWTELAVVSDKDKDGQFQFQGRYAGGLYARYETYLAVRQVDETLAQVKPLDLHDTPRPLTWIEGTKINEAAS